MAEAVSTEQVLLAALQENVRLKRELEDARAAADHLRKALKPFARRADAVLFHGKPDDETVSVGLAVFGPHIVIKVGDYRRAREACEAYPGNEGGAQ